MLRGGQEHLKIKTRLVDEVNRREVCECVVSAREKGRKGSFFFPSSCDGHILTDGENAMHGVKRVPVNQRDEKYMAKEAVRILFSRPLR